MTAIVVSMLIILAICLGTTGLVLVGMQGRGKGRAPKWADRMARAARHLNGEGTPPRAFLRLLHRLHVT